jgi:hypothetical protein
MMDYKPLDTPIVSNLKLHVELDFNPLVYRQWIESLMYLVSIKLD